MSSTTSSPSILPAITTATSSTTTTAVGGSGNESKLPPKVQKGFGSFHSESVQVLIERPISQYRAPSLPFDIRAPISPTILQGFDHELKQGSILSSKFTEFLRQE
jgi:hypothetical protein